jgi:hypothetical protein
MAWQDAIEDEIKQGFAATEREIVIRRSPTQITRSWGLQPTTSPADKWSHP